MVCPVSFQLNGECKLHFSRLKYLLFHHCCNINICHSRHLILTTPSTVTRQACVSLNNPPLLWHLSAADVVKFNASRHDGDSSVCGRLGRDGDTNVRKRQVAGPRLAWAERARESSLGGMGSCGTA